MGTRQSPAGSSRFGASFLQILMNKYSLFQGCPVDNSSFPGFFCHCVFDPKLGEGRVLISGDGTQALLLWFHVDDLYQQLGLIFQTLKLMPPKTAIHELFSSVLAKNNDKCGRHR